MLRAGYRTSDSAKPTTSVYGLLTSKVGNHKETLDAAARGSTPEAAVFHSHGDVRGEEQKTKNNNKKNNNVKATPVLSRSSFFGDVPLLRR